MSYIFFLTKSWQLCFDCVLWMKNSWTVSILPFGIFKKLSWYYCTEILPISAKSIWHTKPHSSQQKYEICFNFCVILKILGVAASRIFNFCILVSVLALFILLTSSTRLLHLAWQFEEAVSMIFLGCYLLPKFDVNRLFMCKPAVCIGVQWTPLRIFYKYIYL